MGKKAKCCICGQEIDRVLVECYKTSAGYFHLECLEEFKKAHPRVKKFELLEKRKVEEAEEYTNKIYDYLTKEVGMKVDYGELAQQCKDYKTKYKYSYNGIYLTLRYFYGVKKSSPEKSNNRIGIVPYIYEEARTYYENLARRKEEINKTIINQKDNIDEVIVVPHIRVVQDRHLIDIDSI